MSNVREHIKCRICRDPLPSPFLSLGHQPPANNLLDEPHQPEESYPLDVTRCPGCGLVQLSHVVRPEVLFKHYLYVPSTSQSMRQHFAAMADALTEFCPPPENPLTVDIGSNDGLLLSYLKAKGVRVMGVEPAENLATEAEVRGIPTVCDFLGASVAEEILSREGQAHVITATNVFAHVDGIDELTFYVSKLLQPDGVFVIEVPDLGEMLSQGTFDLIYHEHLSYFALSPLARFFADQGMAIFRLQPVSTHGGSLRIFVQGTQGTRPVEASVAQRLASEQEWVGGEERYARFAEYVEATKEEFIALIRERRSQGRRIAGYGLPAKANTLLNYYALTAEQIEYIVDDNPLKQGKWAPGSRVPVVAASRLDEDPVESIVIFPWNLADEIRAKLVEYEERGVEFLVPVQSEVLSNR